MITTARLRLRPFRDDDLDALLAYRRDPAVARYQSWSETFSETDAREFIRAVATTPLGTKGAWVNLAVEIAGAGELVGDAALRVEIDGSSGEIGFTFARQHQGHGFATEAVGALCVLALRTVPRLFAITDARNQAAIRLLERLSFRHAGFHARDIVFKGERCDELRFERAATVAR